jgi:hypothetical protein
MLFFAFCLQIFTRTSAIAVPPPQDSCTLPPGLHNEITKNYPGAKLVTLADLDEYDRELWRKNHGVRCPGLVKVDFYGDGKPTWALVLIMGGNPVRKAQFVVAHRAADKWETRTLETTSGTPVVWREPPGTYRQFDGAKKILARNSAIAFVGLESWAIVYAWDGKKVMHVQVSD